MSRFRAARLRRCSWRLHRDSAQRDMHSRLHELPPAFTSHPCVSLCVHLWSQVEARITIHIIKVSKCVFRNFCVIWNIQLKSSCFDFFLRLKSYSELYTYRELSMGSQRVGHDWATELNWTERELAHLKLNNLFCVYDLNRFQVVDYYDILS